LGKLFVLLEVLLSILLFDEQEHWLIGTLFVSGVLVLQDSIPAGANYQYRLEWTVCWVVRPKATDRNFRQLI
jgi:hypothetical protein